MDLYGGWRVVIARLDAMTTVLEHVLADPAAVPAHPAGAVRAVGDLVGQLDVLARRVGAAHGDRLDPDTLEAFRDAVRHLAAAREGLRPVVDGLR
jgi:hypothetical protein